jgi:hypothetical protein
MRGPVVQLALPGDFLADGLNIACRIKLQVVRNSGSRLVLKYALPSMETDGDGYANVTMALGM